MRLLRSLALFAASSLSVSFHRSKELFAAAAWDDAAVDDGPICELSCSSIMPSSSRSVCDASTCTAAAARVAGQSSSSKSCS